MKKTYWWRILITLFGFLILFYGWMASFGNTIGLCHIENDKELCLINYNSYIDSLGFVSISLLVVSLFLYFINDIVFKKWLKFAIVWFALATIFIIHAPTYSSTIPGNPTKESISIWMSSLFVIISIIQIGILSRRHKNL